MPTEDLVYYPNEKSAPVRLVRDPSRFTVRFGRERSGLSQEGLSILRGRSAPVRHLAHYDITVYESPSVSDRSEAVSVLNRERDIELAAPVLHRGSAERDDVYVTRRFVVQFWPEVTRAQIDALNAEHHVTIVEELGYAPNGFLLSAPPGSDGTGAIAMANAYRETGLTRFAHPDLISRRHRRAATVVERAPAAHAERDGDYLARQWHLEHARVKDAWNITRGSSAITVAILDDGIDVDHRELTAAVTTQFDFTAHVADGRPKSASDNHGTACAGVAVARGLRASGAAPDCGLMAVRFPADLGDSDEATMFQWAADNGADVISCSWGPPDGTGQTDPLPGATQAAIRYCIDSGRGGKGTPVCFAAGNGDESVDLDGYASNPDVMAIAACTDHDTRSWYSDYGDAIWVCAPSSGDRDAGEQAILTTDRHGIDGYNSGSGDVDADYTSTFGGTSSASPLVAGIVGLMLSANPDLTVQDVWRILRDTARKIGSGYDSAGHSPQFGYGKVDAYEAVRQSQSGGGPAPGTRAPSITAPDTLDSGGDPPQFDIDPGDGPMRWYAVEVTSRAELFDDAGHGSERTDAEFFASWQAEPLLAETPYTLPDDAWSRLRGAPALFYRAYMSTSADAWTDVIVTTADDDYASAPSIRLTDESVRSAPVRSAAARRARDAVIRRKREATTTHAGLDRLAYPGDAIMQALWDSTNLAWTGFYLAPAPSQGNTSWMSKAATLRGMGWGLAPIFVGQQWQGGPGSHTVTAAQGTTDAATAVRLADQAGIGDNAVVYLDIEIGGTLPAALLQYANAWFAGMRGTNYRPGVYCSYLQTPAQLRRDNPDIFFWVFNVNRFSPTQGLDADGRFRTPPIEQSGCDFATAWQYIQGAPSIPVPRPDGTTGSLATVDLDCATVLDPSYPERTGDGGSGTTTTPRAPSISGPASAERGGSAPVFAIDPGDGPMRYYAVEVATRPELLDDADFGGERTADEFYASWQDEALLATDQYELPSSVWERLSVADALYYRAFFSTSPDEWVDLVVTTADEDYASAPSVVIAGAVDERDAPARREAPERAEHPVAVGPPETPRDGGPPAFALRLPASARSFVFEAATDAALFPQDGAERRSASTYFASPPLRAAGTETYALPGEAWESLRGGERLYYRVSTSSRPPGGGWRAQDRSTPDSTIERAPWIDVSAGERERTVDGERTRVLDPDELNWRDKSRA